MSDLLPWVPSGPFQPRRPVRIEGVTAVKCTEVAVFGNDPRAHSPGKPLVCGFAKGGRVRELNLGTSSGLLSIRGRKPWTCIITPILVRGRAINNEVRCEGGKRSMKC